MLYKLVFDFIIPVYRTTRKVRNGFREMNEKMRQQTEAFHQPHAQVQKSKVEENNSGEYIDFEEVKD